MIAPDFRHGYLRVPLSLWKLAYCRTPLTRRQLQLVSVVLRESWGWQEGRGSVRAWTRPLTSRQFAEATGLSTDHVARDLRRLVELGVLAEQDRRYRLEAGVKLWITLGIAPPRERHAAPNETGSGAEKALLPGSLKKEKITHSSTLPPAGETVARRRAGSLLVTRQAVPLVAASPAAELPTPPGSSDPSAAASAPASSALARERFADVVAAFVGTLSPEEADQLTHWICAEGIAAVWGALEPAFRLGADAGRAQLTELLREHASPAPGGGRAGTGRAGTDA
ncbi:MAG: replication protein [Armatimonadota bacterium]